MIPPYPLVFSFFYFLCSRTERVNVKYIVILVIGITIYFKSTVQSIVRYYACCDHSLARADIS